MGLTQAQLEAMMPGSDEAPPEEITSHPATIPASLGLEELLRRAVATPLKLQDLLRHAVECDREHGAAIDAKRNADKRIADATKACFDAWSAYRDVLEEYKREKPEGRLLADEPTLFPNEPAH